MFLHKCNFTGPLARDRGLQVCVHRVTLNSYMDFKQTGTHQNNLEDKLHRTTAPECEG